MRIHYDNEQHAADFIRLNEAWIGEYFRLEEADRALARDPMRIVREGGSILTLSNRGEVIGACALLREEDGVMQLARMAVAAGERGKGWGRILLPRRCSGRASWAPGACACFRTRAWAPPSTSTRPSASARCTAARTPGTPAATS